MATDANILNELFSVVERNTGLQIIFMRSCVHVDMCVM